MADNALENAKALSARLSARLKEMEAERLSIEKQLADVNAFLRAADAYASLNPGEVPTGAVTPSVVTRDVSGKRARNPRREETVAAVIEIVTAADRPMQLRELYEALVARGFTFHGTDPVAVLGTQLWRGTQDGELTNIKGSGYWPARQPQP
jgi:hypothetical protein